MEQQIDYTPQLSLGGVLPLEFLMRVAVYFLLQVAGKSVTFDLDELFSYPNYGLKTVKKEGSTQCTISLVEPSEEGKSND